MKHYFKDKISDNPISKRTTYKLLKSGIEKDTSENDECTHENQTRNVYTPTKSVRISSTQNSGSNGPVTDNLLVIANLNR